MPIKIKGGVSKMEFSSKFILIEHGEKLQLILCTSAMKPMIISLITGGLVSAVLSFAFDSFGFLVTAPLFALIPLTFINTDIRNYQEFYLKQIVLKEKIADDFKL